MDSSTTTAPSGAMATQTGQKMNVRFVLDDPFAREVFVAGTFNNWEPSAAPLTNSGEGRWTTEIPLPAGHYEYQFVVDGNWMTDPAAKHSVLNPFGGRNSVVFVRQMG